MRRYRLVMGIAVTLHTVIVCGCGRSDVEEAEPVLPAWLTEQEPPAEAETITLAEAATSDAPAVETAALQLSLTPGDRFPLRKVVDQELKQASLNGVPQISRSHLELLLAITVEDVQPDRTRLSVRYDRVRYTHDVAGEQVQYDSAAPPAQIPAAALAYHAMVDDGFTFELGAGHQVVGVTGFREFLERCLQHVPDDQRGRVMLDIEANSGEKGIADFVDNTIGLLPPGGDKALGETWEKARHIGRPIPMQINTVYTLTGINDRIAVIGIAGDVSPSTMLGESSDEEPDQSVRIVVQGGHCEGRCTLYRDSGLPKESRVERIVDMVVQTGGIEFTQQKRTITTVESNPVPSAQSLSKTAEASAPRFQ